MNRVEGPHSSKLHPKLTNPRCKFDWNSINRKAITKRDPHLSIKLTVVRWDGIPQDRFNDSNSTLSFCLWCGFVSPDFITTPNRCYMKERNGKESHYESHAHSNNMRNDAKFMQTYQQYVSNYPWLLFPCRDSNLVDLIFQVDL